MDKNNYNPHSNSVTITIPKDTTMNVKTLELTLAAIAQKIVACNEYKAGDQFDFNVRISLFECGAPSYAFKCAKCDEPNLMGVNTATESVEIRPPVDYYEKENDINVMDQKWLKAANGNSLVFDKTISKHIIKTGHDISAGQEIIIIKPKY